MVDEHATTWDRFCWFGFKPVLRKKNHLKIGVPQKKSIEPGKQIGDMEALLILVTDPKNLQKMKFSEADEFKQVCAEETGKIMKKAQSR